MNEQEANSLKFILNSRFYNMWTNHILFKHVDGYNVTIQDQNNIPSGKFFLVITFKMEYINIENTVKNKSFLRKKLYDFIDLVAKDIHGKTTLIIFI